MVGSGSQKILPSDFKNGSPSSDVFLGSVYGIKYLDDGGFNKGLLLNGGIRSGLSRRWSAPGKLAKIKPENISSFVQRKSKREAIRNRIFPLHFSFAQDEEIQENCPNKNLDSRDFFRMESAPSDRRSKDLNEKRAGENNHEDTRAWVERTFYKNSGKASGLGGGTESVKTSEKWRALELLNRVEKNKNQRKASLKDHQEAASEPLNTTAPHSCKDLQIETMNPPYKRKVTFSKGAIQVGPKENITTATKSRMPSLRKDTDHQKGVNIWVNDSTKNLKTKALWAQRFYRNPNRKPFQWNFNSGGEEEGEDRQETLEDGLETREEDLDRLNVWNSSDNEEVDPSEDDLSTPESNEGEYIPPKTEDILKDVSQLYKEETDENTQPDAQEEKADCRKVDELNGRLLKKMSHEEWKIINKVVEGAEIQEVPIPKYKGTNRGKTKKGMRELRGLQISLNYESSSRKMRETKIIK